MIRRSITAKLALTSVACVFSVMAIFGAYSYVSEKNRLEALIDSGAHQLHERLLGNLRLPVYQFDKDQIDAVLRLEIQADAVSSIVVRNESGEILAGKAKDADRIVRELALKVEPGERGDACYKRLVAPLRFESLGDSSVIGSVDLCINDRALKASMHSLVVTMAVQTVLVSLILCICLFISLRLVLLRPILLIRDAVDRFARKDFSSRSSLRSSDELGELGKNFNNMAAMIEKHNEALERTIEERTLELVKKNEIIVLEKELAEAATQAKTQLLAEQQELIRKLEDAQGLLLQSEKMASVGQLAAGVAHEINNPIGFINSNLGSLKGQVDQLLSVIAVYQSAETALAGHLDLLEAIREAKLAADFEFLQEDIQNLIAESLDGVNRVKKIVDNLKDFSRVDTAEWHYANLERGLDSALSLVWNEIKDKVEIRKAYAGLPEIECIASQINQVFMNILLNAGHAIDERGIISLRTGFDEDTVWVEIEDDGIGIKPENLKRIFEPFFTTKPVGRGTGLGLSLAYGIVQRHRGRIEVRSELGGGSVFRVILPKQRARSEDSV